VRIVSWSEEDADTASILVITPPQDQIERIRTLQVECGVSTDVVPHVTVKAQPGLTDRSRWVQPLRERLRRHRPFALRFIGVGQFGEEIVYLGVGGNGIRRLHNTILDVLDRLGVEERFEYDGESYEPHLTLAASFAGADATALREIGLRARRLNVPSFEVGAIIELHRPGRGELYQPLEQFALAPPAEGG